jgi:hypothetical protein
MARAVLDRNVAEDTRSGTFDGMVAARHDGVARMCPSGVDSCLFQVNGPRMACGEHWMTESSSNGLGARRGSGGIAAPGRGGTLWIQANR